MAASTSRTPSCQVRPGAAGPGRRLSPNSTTSLPTAINPGYTGLVGGTQPEPLIEAPFGVWVGHVQDRQQLDDKVGHAPIVPRQPVAVAPGADAQQAHPGGLYRR